MNQLIVHVINDSDLDARVESKVGTLLLQPGEEGLLRVKPGRQVVTVRSCSRGSVGIITVQEVDLAFGPFQEARLHVKSLNGRLALAS